MPTRRPSAFFVAGWRPIVCESCSAPTNSKTFGLLHRRRRPIKKEPTNLRLLTRSSALRLMWLSLWWYVAQFERSFLTQQIWFSSYLLSEQEFPIYSLCQRKKTMRNSDIAQHNASFTATHGRSGYLFAPHVLRHTKAFRLLETGINVFYIRNLLRR